MANRPPTPSIPRDSKVQFGFNYRQHKPTHLVFVSGSHVIGKTHLASSLADILKCPWFEGDEIHAFASASANMIAGPSNAGSEHSQAIFRQNAVARMNRMGIALRVVTHEDHSFAEEEEEEEEGQESAAQEAPEPEAGPRCLILTFPAHRKWHREALRDHLETMDGRAPLKLLFILLMISTDMLRERYLGAETEELAESNFAKKVADIQNPDANEAADVVVVDGEKSVEDQLNHSLQLIQDRFGFEERNV